MRHLPALLGLVVALTLVLVLPGGAEVAFIEVKELSPSHRQDSGRFGGSVSVSGDIAIVGACCEDGGHFLAGAAYIFARDQGGAGNWGEVKRVTSSDAQSGDRFGASVAVSGDIAVVGADLEDAGGRDAGAAYVFQRDEGGADNWGEVAKLSASDGEAGDSFGFSVALSGGIAVVGARFEEAAYVLGREKGGADNWGEVKKLTPSAALGSFGWNVAVTGDTATVGASFVRASFVFQRDEGGVDNWGEVKKRTLADAQVGERFGNFAISGDTAVVMASRGGLWLASSASVFRRDDGGANNWGEVKKLTFSAGGQFGDVALGGDTAVVLARLEDAAGIHSGAAYFFRRHQGGADNWGEVAKLTFFNPQARGGFGDAIFNSRVAVSGDVAVVGVGFGDAWGIDAGAAYVFRLYEGGAESYGLGAAVAAGIVAAVVAGILYGPHRFRPRRSEG